jgi:hypothetical protein
MSYTECTHCNGVLLKDHRDIGICAWCIKELNDRDKAKSSMPVPGYSNEIEDDINEDDNELPIAEEWL